MMNYGITAIAALSVLLASCGGGSGGGGNKEFEPAIVPKPQPDIKQPARNDDYPLAAKGYGIKDGQVIGASGQLVTPNALDGINTTKTGTEIQYKGDPGTAAPGTLFTSRRTSKDDSSMRYLMSDASASHNKAPTSFGLVNSSGLARRFDPVALYGGQAPTNLQTSGQASYKGRYASVVGGADGSKNRSGEFTLNADFNSAVVNGSVKNVTQYENNASSAVANSDIAFKAGMDSTKSSYSTANGEGNFVTFGNVASSTAKAEGGFFGPDGSETSGVLIDSAAGHESVGAFHGSRQ